MYIDKCMDEPNIFNLKKEILSHATIEMKLEYIMLEKEASHEKTNTV